jgi:hypothetical protein
MTLMVAALVITGWYAKAIINGPMVQQDPSFYDYNDFSYPNGKSMNSTVELEEAFKAYDFPKFTDFWITIVAAVIIHYF